MVAGFAVHQFSQLELSLLSCREYGAGHEVRRRSGPNDVLEGYLSSLEIAVSRVDCIVGRRTGILELLDGVPLGDELDQRVKVGVPPRRGLFEGVSASDAVASARSTVRNRPLQPAQGIWRSDPSSGRRAVACAPQAVKLQQQSQGGRLLM